MRKKTINTDKPIGEMTRIKDFLPPPEDLIVPERTVKVTILLSESSINSFKRFAKKHHTKYQKLIRNLLDKYAEKYLIHS
ncbi:CopG family transcriptional regulator [Candidatus Omnitrophota bacterium]